MNIRTEFITKIISLPEEYREIVIKAFERTICEYDITAKETHLAIPIDNKKELRAYVSCRLLEGKSDLGTNNSKIFLNKMLDFVNVPVTEITPNMIRAFLYDYQDKNQIVGGTLNSYRGMLNSFFEWCIAEGIIKESPMRNIKRIKYEQPQRKSMTQMELEIIRSACKTPKEKCMVEVLYSTGCRVSEVAKIKISDIDFNQNTIVVHGKGKKIREVFLNAKAQISIKEYLEARKGNCEYLFSKERKVDGVYEPMSARAIRDLIALILKRTNITKKVTPHVFRHTTATIGLQNGMPIESIQKMLGHASCSTTMVYAEVSTEKVHSEHLRCVI